MVRVSAAETAQPPLRAVTISARVVDNRLSGSELVQPLKPGVCPQRRFRLFHFCQNFKEQVLLVIGKNVFNDHKVKNVKHGVRMLPRVNGPTKPVQPVAFQSSKVR